MSDKTTIKPEANKKNWNEINDPSCLVVKPLVSVSMITYNHEKYIEEAINSVLMQETDFGVELIISNDNSPDQTDTIIQRILKEHPKSHWIKYIKHETNIGMVPNWMDNIQRCSGKYIAVCEGDDYWTDKEKLIKQVRFLELNPEYVISGHDAFIIDAQGNTVKDSKLPVEFQRDFSKEELILGKGFILTLSWVFRNVGFKHIPEHSKMLNSDRFIISLLGKYGKSKYQTDIKPSAYRVHQGGVWSMLNQIEKRDGQINSLFWTYRYYQRIGEKKYAAHYWNMYIALTIPCAETKTNILAKELIIRCIFLREMRSVIPTLLVNIGLKR